MQRAHIDPFRRLADDPGRIETGPWTRTPTKPIRLSSPDQPQAWSPYGSPALPPTIVAEMTEVSFLSLEVVAALLTLTRRCGDDGQDLRIEPSSAVRRKMAFDELGQCHSARRSVTMDNRCHP
jgi:hypothetical protein